MTAKESRYATCSSAVIDDPDPIRFASPLDLSFAAAAFHQSGRAAADQQQRSRLRYLGERQLVLRLLAVAGEQIDHADAVVDPTRVHVRFGERDERVWIADDGRAEDRDAIA